MYKINPRGIGEELHFLKNLKGEQMTQKENNISPYKSGAVFFIMDCISVRQRDCNSVIPSLFSL